MRPDKKILASAYAINPYKGSEDGMGWNFICQVARYHYVIAVTRENNRPAIERYMSENPDKVYNNMQFLYFDAPYWMRFWKKGKRWAMLYYLLWQRLLPGFVRKMKLDFDIAHNLNFHNDWTPSFLWKLGKPFVWGPVGHHPLIPAQFLTPYKRSYFIKDRFLWLIKNLFWKISPSLKKTIQKADHILCMNSRVAHHLGLAADKYSIVPSVATGNTGFSVNLSSDTFHLISAGRLVPLKGFDLGILAFADFLSKINASERAHVKLTIVGSGPELGFYKKLIIENYLENHVELVEWMDRDALLEKFRKSSAFLFPSHEGAGMVVAEALSFGLPVICLDNCGPGEFINPSCGIRVPVTDYHSTIAYLSAAIHSIYADNHKRLKMSLNARKQFEKQFDWNMRGGQLKEIYKNIHA